MKQRSRLSHRPATITPASPPATSTDGTVSTFDIHQNPDSTVTSTTDGGGPILTNVEVVVIFWGSYWASTSPPPAVPSATFYQCFSGIVTGPYLTGLRQYRGIGPGSMLGQFSNPADPPNPYADSDVVTMLTNYLTANASVPAPLAGHNRFYAVVTPPGFANTLPDEGQHQSFTFNGAQAYYAWISDDGNGLTEGSSNGVVNTFSHELAEACSDPQGNAIIVNGNQEIGDICNSEYAIVQMNGVTCNVQCYWSAADNACIIPLGSLSFLVNKSTFGIDEVKEALKTNNGVFSNAFWLALDDFSINAFNSFQVAVPTPTGPFANVAGITISLTPATPSKPNPVYEDPTNLTDPQRIRFSYDINFAKPLITPFPSGAPQTYTLSANFTTAGVVVPGVNSSDTIEFELVAGEDPYFSNVDSTDNSAVAWLSQDLRVFPLTQSQSALPGDPNAPVFSSSQTAYQYIQALLGYLNTTAAYTTPVPPSSPDPLNGLPNQQGYETGDSSVNPLDSSGNQNYNFAIARVRLTSDVQGSASEATNVRVFFRLWVAPSFDTDFQPYTTYLSNPGYPSLPNNPLASGANLPPDPSGQAIQTTPFFATDKTGSNDYNTAVQNNNIQTLQIPVVPGRDSVWAYYGCFLDVYDSHNNTGYSSTHHCLVAQIAYDGAPLIYQSNVETNPGNTDKLAQRNLQITSSGNPGPASTHRVPQAFDTRPSPQILGSSGAVLNEPDEIMIDWGNTPVGATAHIYWPQVAATDVLALAARFHGTHLLTATDPHTISCNVVNGATYIPIPSAAQGQNFAGLLTVDLPLGVRKGHEFNILVRRIATKQIQDINIQKAPAPARNPGAGSQTGTVAAGEASVPARKWRYITGAFQIKIPVITEAEMLGPEENTLAILKARLAAMPKVYRWYPVLERYIGIVSGRVDGSNGNAALVPPSLLGYHPAGGGHGAGPGHAGGAGHGAGHEGHGDHDRDHEKSHTGKISGLIFDHFGDFEGFLLDTETGEHRFDSRERDMKDLVERAWKERLRVTVWTRHHERRRARTIIVRDPPARFGI